MELIKDEKIQKEKKLKKNENMPKKYTGPIEHNLNSMNKFDINEMRNYMNNNKTNSSENHLITDINVNNLSFKDKDKSKNIESLESSNNNELVMNQNYNYNPKPFSNNSSQQYYSNNNEIIHNNILSISYPDFNKYNNTDNYQYYSEQKAFNPALLIDFSTKKSTRSSNSHYENENDNEIGVKDEIICKNGGRSSLTNMINDYIDYNGFDENENNIKDNKMTMNSFDSPEKNNDSDFIDNDNVNYEENNNNNVELSGNKNKTINSEKMNLNNEEINNLLKDKNENENLNENEEMQLSGNYISSKNSKNKKEKNKIKNIDINNAILKEKKISSDDNVDKIVNNMNIIKKNKILKEIPFQGNYIEYKEYEKYIIGNNHDELLNTGNEEDIFGNFVDNIIKKSYHVYTNRQCPSCANLLTNGKSCVNCPKYHHLIKNGKNKKIKNKK